MGQVQLQPAYVLHRRPFRETSLLVDFFTRDFGRVSAVARGARKAASKRRWQLEPFQPLLVSWYGAGELKQLHQVEGNGSGCVLSGEGLYCGLYLNELLQRLLAADDKQQDIFQAYWQSVTTLSLLKERQDIEPVLRRFELSLVEALGYGISLHTDALLHQAIAAEQCYRLDVAQGFIPVAHGAGAAQTFMGRELLAIAAGDYSSTQLRTVAKRLNRQLLAPLLGPKPLLSRSLFAHRAGHTEDQV